MKRIALLIAVLMMGTLLFAQEKDQKRNDDDVQTLFGNTGKITHGWFIELRSGYSQIKSHDAWTGGLAAGWIINHNFNIGLTGSGFGDRKNLYFENIQDSLGAYLEGCYGGLLLEYTLFPKSVVHITFPVMIGGGSISMVSKEKFYEQDGDKMKLDHKMLTEDAFFIVEPGARIEFNILKFLRLNAGVSYRYVPDLNLNNMSSNLLNNLNGSIGLKFGKF